MAVWGLMGLYDRMWVWSVGAEIEDNSYVYGFGDGILLLSLGCRKKTCLEGKDEVSLGPNEFGELVGDPNGNASRLLNA